MGQCVDNPSKDGAVCRYRVGDVCVVHDKDPSTILVVPGTLFRFW